MKSFLEEYGFAISAAIVVILLIAMCTPVGNMIKTQVLNTVDRFAGTADKKLASSNNDEMSANIIGGTLYVQSNSTTDQYTVVLHGTKAGLKHTIALADPDAGVGEAVKSWNLDVSEFDVGSTYYAEVTNVGTGAVFTSNIAVNNGITTGGATLSAQEYADASDLIEGTIAKGELIQIDNKEYRILAVNGTEIKVLAMTNYTSTEFNSSFITTSFNGTNGQKYADSNLDAKMTEFYNSLSYKDAIVAQNIKQSMYQYSGEPDDLGVVDPYKYHYSWRDSDWENLQFISSVDVGERYVYALEIDDVYDYVGKNTISSNELNKMFFKTTSFIREYVWLRSAYAGYSNYAFRADGYGGSLRGHDYYNTYGVRPAFTLDLSKLG